MRRFVGEAAGLVLDSCLSEGIGDEDSTLSRTDGETPFLLTEKKAIVGVFCSDSPVEVSDLGPQIGVAGKRYLIFFKSSSTSGRNLAITV